MKKYLVATLALCLLAAPALAVEDLTLTAPETQPNTTVYRFDSLSLSRSAQSVNVTFLDPTNGRTKSCSESGAAAATLMSTLNTANLTSNSLQKRVTNWAIGKNCLGAGAISGTPD